MCLAALAPAAHAADAPLSVSEVNEHIDLYRGKVVTVRGFFFYAPPHQHFLWGEGPEVFTAPDRRERGPPDWDRLCLDVINFEALYRRNLRKRWVTITGKVLAAAPKNEVINLSGCAGWNSIWMERVKADREPPGGRAK